MKSTPTTDDRRFKLIYLRDDVTGSGLAVGEGAAYDLQTATRLVATGMCRIDESETEKEALEAAVTAYRAPRPSERRWELALCQPRYFDLHPSK